MTDQISTYAEAITALSTDAIAASLIEDMSDNGVDVTGFSTYSVPLSLSYLQARAERALQLLRVKLVQAGFPTTAYLAGSSWVDVSLGGWFQEPRLPASASQWLLRVSAAAGVGPYPVAPGELVAQDAGGITYVNVDKVTIPAGGSRNILFRARTEGVVGNPGTGLIDHLIVGKPGLSVTNPAGSLVLAGRDQESDGAYLVRCLGKWGTQGKGGNALAYYYLVPKAAPTITRILIRQDNPFGPGSIGLCLANAAGAATPTEVQAVANLLVPDKPLGSGPLVVFAAFEQTVQVVAQLFAGAANPDAVTAGYQALELLSSTYPIGSVPLTKLYKDKLIEVLMEVPEVFDVKFTKPTGDVGLGPYNVIKIAPTLTAVFS